MKREVAINSPAKLNLFLEVLGRRSDGFHEIETLMLPIGWFDSVVVRARSDDRLTLSARWVYGTEARAVRGESPMFGDLPTGETNLALRALMRLREAAGVCAGAEIDLVKRIPSAAGLGGASSNAAAALWGANRIWDLNWPVERLAEVAAELGSDVPFFLGDGERVGPAVCRGRGERTERVDMSGRFHFVVVRPPEGLATALVYRACRPAEHPVSADGLIDALRCGNAAGAARAMLNRLEEPARELSPWIERMRRLFDRIGFLGHQMSGSGTSYFGVSPSARHARIAARRLTAAGWLAIAVSSLVAPMKR